MTLEETVDVLNIIKLAYPNFYGTKGAADLDKREICKLWATMFAEDDFDSVLAAVKTYIATDTTGFGPTVGQLKDLERRLTHRDAMTEAEAWGLVSKAISNGLYGAGEEFAKLPPLLQRLVGSPAQLGEWARMDSAAVQSVVASNFQRAFRVAQEREDWQKNLPPDVRELIEAVAPKNLTE